MPADVTPISWSEAPDLMSLEEARRVLRCGRRQMYELATEEDGPGVRVRGAWRVPKSALREYVRRQLPEDLQHTMANGSATTGEDGDDE